MQKKAKSKAKSKAKAASKTRNKLFVDHLIKNRKASKLEGEALDIAMKESVAFAPDQVAGGGAVEASTGGGGEPSSSVPELDQVTGGS